MNIDLIRKLYQDFEKLEISEPEEQKNYLIKCGFDKTLVLSVIDDLIKFKKRTT